MESIKKAEEILDLTSLNMLNNNDNNFQAESSEVVFISGKNQSQSSIGDELLSLNVSESIESLSFASVAQNGLSEVELDVVVDKVLSAITDMANAKYKGTSFIEPDEIDNVMKILDAESCGLSVKNDISNELTKFQNSITENYNQQIDTINATRIELEDTLDVLTKEKSKIVNQRIAQLLWPFNDVTRMYDNKIYNVKCRIKSCEAKIEQISSMRPMAREKDILKFNIELKQKLNS